MEMNKKDEEFDVKSVLKGFFNKQSGLSVFMACNVCMYVPLQPIPV